MRTDHGGEFWNVVAGAVVGGAVSFITATVPEIISWLANPKDKRAWGRAARKAWRQIGGEFGSGIVSSAASDFSFWYGAEYTKRFFNYGFGG